MGQLVEKPLFFLGTQHRKQMVINVITLLAFSQKTTSRGKNSPMTFNWPDCEAELPCLLVAVQEYSPLSFLVTLLMIKVPFSSTWCLLSMGKDRPSAKKGEEMHKENNRPILNHFYINEFSGILANFWKASPLGSLAIHYPSPSHFVHSVISEELRAELRDG